MTIDREISEVIQSAVADELPLVLEFREIPESNDGARFELSHGTVHQGFVITGTVGWKSMELEFSPKTYSASIVRFLENVFFNNREITIEAIDCLTPLRGKVEIEANGMSVPAERVAQLPEQWKSLIIRAEFGPTEIRDTTNTINSLVISERLHAFSAMLRMLLPLELVDDTFDLDDKLLGLPEGARITIQVNRYERSRANREACIRIYGTRCLACGFDYEAVYGSAGQGYIQVHHVIPVATFKEARPVNPKTDLIPLCANCHSMAHRREPPYTIDELRVMHNRNIKD